MMKHRSSGGGRCQEGDPLAPAGALSPGLRGCGVTGVSSGTAGGFGLRLQARSSSLA